MNHFSDSSVVPFAIIRFPDGFEVSWAGPNPVESGFCFGSLDGRMLFTDEDGKPLRPPGKGSVSREAINGVARVGTYVVISTRQEVNFWPLQGTEGGHDFGVPLPHGAHGVTTTPSGYCIAPLGRTGIMAAKPPFGLGKSITVYGSEKEGLYAYRVIGLRSEAGGEVLACAARSGGIASVEFSGSAQAHAMTTAKIKGLDVVDICPLRPGEDSLAVGALGRDGSVVLFQDVVRDKKPVTIKFQRVQGVAYRLLSCLEDIYLLTTKGVYVLGKLASRFLDKELASGVVTPILALPMDAADMNFASNRWLLVVMSDEVRRFDMSDIHASVPEQIQHAEVQEFQQSMLIQEWEWQGVEQTTKEYAFAG